MRHELIHAFLYISIHAPTRGATKWIPCCGQSAHISIHAPARGATNSASMMSALSLFQSTLPQGERPYIQNQTRHFVYFNPRSHKGSDSDELRTALTEGYFNPRSHKGSDVDDSDYTDRRYISIHAPTRGATAILHKIPYLFYFIFTNPFPISYFHTQPASDF